MTSKSRFNGKYETVGRRADGAVVLLVREIRPIPRYEILLMRSPTRSATTMDVIHNISVDRNGKDLIYSGQIDQAHGENNDSNTVKTVTIKDVPSHSTLPANLEIVINEFRRIPVSGGAAESELMFSSTYHFFKAMKSGNCYCSLKVKNFLTKDEAVILFKETCSPYSPPDVTEKERNASSIGLSQLNSQDDPDILRVLSSKNNHRVRREFVLRKARVMCRYKKSSSARKVKN